MVGKKKQYYCTRCPKTIFDRRPNALYCKECAKEKLKEQKAGYARKRYLKKKKEEE